MKISYCGVASASHRVGFMSENASWSTQENMKPTQLVFEAELAPRTAPAPHSGPIDPGQLSDTTARGDADWLRPRSSAKEQSLHPNACACLRSGQRLANSAGYGPTQLAEKHGYELAPTNKSASVTLGFVLPDSSLKLDS
jgi:hypothetical protein